MDFPTPVRQFRYEELAAFEDNDFASAGRIAISVDSKHIFFKESCHSHDYYELAYIRCGDGIQIINGVSYSVSRGDVVLFRLGDVHTYYSFNNMEVINCCIRPELIPVLAKEEYLSARIIRLTEESRHDFENLITLLHEECRQKQEFAEEAAVHYLGLILIILRRNLSRQSPEEQRWNELLFYLSGHYSTVTLEDAAEWLHLTKNYFCRAFRRRTGTTLNNYLNQLRLTAAVEMLRFSDTSVSEIWQKTGFRQAKQFYKLFKQELGMTPLQFRMQYRDK